MKLSELKPLTRGIALSALTFIALSTMPVISLSTMPVKVLDEKAQVSLTGEFFKINQALDLIKQQINELKAEMVLPKGLATLNLMLAKSEEIRDHVAKAARIAADEKPPLALQAPDEPLSRKPLPPTPQKKSKEAPKKDLW